MAIVIFPASALSILSSSLATLIPDLETLEIENNDTKASIKLVGNETIRRKL